MLPCWPRRIKSAVRGRGWIWSGLPTLLRGQATRSTTEREICGKTSATLLEFRSRAKLLLGNRLETGARPQLTPIFSTIENYGGFIQNHGLPGTLRRHFHSKLCWSPPTVTSKTPGSTIRLFSKPMKDKSSGVNSKDTRRLSPGFKETFANLFRRFSDGVTLANRLLK